MRIKYLIICIFSVFLLVSCTRDDAPEKGGFKVYRTNANLDTLVWENIDDFNKDDENAVEKLLALLSASPSVKGMHKIIPDGVGINSWFIGQDGQLVLDFNSVYMSMDTAGELMCRAGIVKTLCQLDNVEYVEFQVEGKPLTLQNGNVVRLMTAQDFIDNTGTDTKFAQTVNITVYFTDEEGVEMSESLLRVEYNGQKTLEEIALYELIEGPLAEQTELRPVMPEGTQVNKVSSKDGICYVDFNGNFLNGREGVSDEIIVYSVVNSLVEISYITKVQISIDGTPLKNYGSLTISGALGRRPELITIEKAGETTE